jgi:peptide/nickel transport system permease protein
MRIGPFILRRVLLSLLVLFGLSIIIFIIARIVPGDPARMSLGPRAPQEAVDLLRQEMHLNESLPVQYYYWISGVFRGDFGTSLMTKRPVAQDIVDYLPATLELVFCSGILMVICLFIIGPMAARYRDTWIDNVIRLLSYFGVAIPAFVMAILFVLIFGYLWPVLPVIGRISPGVVPPPTLTGFITIDSLLTGNFPALWDALQHLVMPAVALALGNIFQEARITRATMVSNMRKDYIAAERGYGISERKINLKYLLKPSLIPTISVQGLDFASMMGNAFLVEVIFNWPGISRYGVNAMLQKDLNPISGVILVFGLVFVITNIVVDIIVAYLDPRIRLGGVRGT